MSYALAVKVKQLAVESVSPSEDAAAPHAEDQPSNSGAEEDQVASLRSSASSPDVLLAPWHTRKPAASLSKREAAVQA